ncbi:MAG: radical SAM protein [bacterium]
MSSNWTIKSIRWDITNLCNLRCLHCYTLPLSGKLDLTLSQTLHIIEKLLPYGLKEVNFSGREPTLWKDLPILIEKCVEKNLIVNVTTNGTALDKSSLENLLRAKLNMLVFSLDGASAEVHDEIRGRGNFLKTIDTLKRSKEYLRKFNLPTQIGISCTLQRHNIDDLTNIISLCDFLNIDLLVINPVSLYGNASEKKTLLYLSPEDIFNFWMKVCDEYSKAKPNYELFLGTFPMEAKLLNLKYKLDLPVIQTDCPAGKTLYIDAHGNALPCHMIPPVANINPEIKKYMVYWSVMNEDIYVAQMKFKPFIEFTSRFSQRYIKECNHCPDIDVCKRCPLISLSDQDTINRCQLAQKQIDSLSIETNKMIIPQIKDFVFWRIDDNILSISIKKNGYISEKKFEIDCYVQSLWKRIDGKSSISELTKYLSSKNPKLSATDAEMKVINTIEYFWKEGIIEI